jgi:hypothetical protein
MTAARPTRPAQAGTTTAPGDTVNHVPVRGGRLRDAAAKRGVSLATILVTVAVVVLTYFAGKLVYRSAMSCS